MPHNCYSCHQHSPRSLSLVEKDEWHFMHCMEGHGGREITLRHHQVVRVIKKYAELAGAQVTIEPHHVFSESNKQPDLQIIMNHKCYLFLLLFFIYLSICSIFYVFDLLVDLYIKVHTVHSYAQPLQA